MSPVYKGLSCGGLPLYTIGQGRWPLPVNGSPGAWRRIDGPLQYKTNALHFSPRDRFARWLGPELWECEIRGPVERVPCEVIASEGRLVRKLEGWTPTTARQFAAECVQRAKDRTDKPIAEEALALTRDILAGTVDPLDVMKLRGSVMAEALVSGGPVDHLHWNAMEGFKLPDGRPMPPRDYVAAAAWLLVLADDAAIKTVAGDIAQRTLVMLPYEELMREIGWQSERLFELIGE